MLLHPNFYVGAGDPNIGPTLALQDLSQLALLPAPPVNLLIESQSGRSRLSRPKGP